MEPDKLITVPNGDLPIEGNNKYEVLQDFWLKDIMLHKGQIITDPVSPRWIDLRLIRKICECPKSSETDAIIITTEDCHCEEKRKRGRPKKIEESSIIVESPEPSEELIESTNQTDLSRQE